MYVVYSFSRRIVSPGEGQKTNNEKTIRYETRSKRNSLSKGTTLENEEQFCVCIHLRAILYVVCVCVCLSVHADPCMCGRSRSLLCAYVCAFMQVGMCEWCVTTYVCRNINVCAVVSTHAFVFVVIVSSSAFSPNTRAATVTRCWDVLFLTLLLKRRNANSNCVI